MDQKDRMKIAIESGISLGAIRRFLSGEHIHESTRHGIEAAAAKLKIPLHKPMVNKDVPK